MSDDSMTMPRRSPAFACWISPTCSPVLSAPGCLADLGADVVRVESSKHPDHPWPSAYIERRRPPCFLSEYQPQQALHRHRPETPERPTDCGQRWRRAADVVVENFSAGVMDRLGLGYEQSAFAQSRIIYVSMSGYGHDGPRRDWTSMNMNLQGYSGLMTVTGAEGDPPTAISNSWNDYIGALHACFAILQAVDERATARQRNATGPEPVRVQRRDDRRRCCLASAVNGTDPPRRATARRDSRPRGSIAAPAPTTGAPSACENDDSGGPSDESSARRRWAARNALRDRCRAPAVSRRNRRATLSVDHAIFKRCGGRNACKTRRHPRRTGAPHR